MLLSIEKPHHVLTHKSEGAGLKCLCKSLDVPLEEVLAFGDGDNDKVSVALAATPMLDKLTKI